MLTILITYLMEMGRGLNFGGYVIRSGINVEKKGMITV